MEARHRAEEVRAHYADLAATYDAKANRTCKRHYEMLIARSLSGCRRVLEIGVADAGEPDDLVRERTLGIDERREAVTQDDGSIGLQPDARRADFDDALDARVEPGRLEVQRDEVYG